MTPRQSTKSERKLIKQRKKENEDYERSRRKQKGVSRLDIPKNPRFK